MKNYFALLDPPQKEFALSFLPKNILTLTQKQQERAARQFASRHVWSGADDGIDTNSGLEILRIWQSRVKENSGLGPVTLCGHMAQAYIALCAALGIYARLVVAVGPEGPDNQAEYWDTDQESWVFVHVGINACWLERNIGHRLSYRELSDYGRQKTSDACICSSPTGGLALHPEGNKYGDWTKWDSDAGVSNGNAVYIDKPHDWKLFRIWPPRNKPTLWPHMVENTPMHILYPTL